uniref:ATP synthase subunit a n=1 Tax=Antennariidae sp. TaxID=3075082 RepID=A0AA51X3I8_9TELE|nr:ATP synthase F0 subunit 6 [Antennariidae sp.]
MMLNYFDQFLPSEYLGIPLVIPALIFPHIIFLIQSRKWLSNRVLTLQQWFMMKATHNLFNPLKAQTHKWAALLIALLVYLISLNTLGLLPYTFTPTTQLSINLSLAVPLWLMTLILGMWYQPNLTLAHLLPQGTPTLLIPALVVIETISLCIRPLALGVRLTANLTAGHLLIQLISTASLTLLQIMPTVALMTTVLLIFLTLLEIAVALIQAYVFVLLLILYLEENI